MNFVLDASVALAWCFEDEWHGYADAVLDSLRESEAIAPCHWPLEVANALVAAERRGRIEAAAAARFVELLLTLPIAVDPGTRAGPFTGARRLARTHRLSVYDAEYLDLALRVGAPVATLDAALAAAAEAEGVGRYSPPRE